jgi:hypothetical protein
MLAGASQKSSENCGLQDLCGLSETADHVVKSVLILTLSFTNHADLTN